jgi:hypothetical protein
MEIVCNRCQQPIQAENTFCAACGLPQLVYTAAEAADGQGQAERWTEAARDASVVEWRPAMRIAALFAVPAALLSSGLSPGFGLLWIAAAAAWAVVIYVRKGQGPAWVTIGAGARIGLVTGLFGAWLTFALSGGTLFVQRFVLHSAAQTDAEFKAGVTEKFENLMQQSNSQFGPSDAAQMQAAWSQMEAWMLSPWGRAGVFALWLAIYSFSQLFFAVGGGALGARLVARMKRPKT